MSLPVRQLSGRSLEARPLEVHKAETPRGLRLVSLSEVLTALSYALDLTGGLPEGHSIRTCMIGMRIAHSLGLSDDERAALYDAVLLKDAGSSSNSAYVTALFDSADIPTKRRLRWTDPQRLLDSGLRIPHFAAPLKSRWVRMLHFVGRVNHKEIGRDLVRIRSDRGAKLALRLGFPRTVAHAIRSLDEQWNGCGLPDGKRGAEIPLLSRIANLAQIVEGVRCQHGVSRALQVARERRGFWFDPKLVDLICEWENDAEWWARLQSPDLTAEVLALKPSDHIRLVDERGVDNVARAFADIIDAKSPFTYQHSTRVAEYACLIATRLGLQPFEIRRLRRAAWLHDIGKLGVSSSVLDKSGPLTRFERQQMQRHPVYTWEILSRVSAFEDFATMAARHHEKLDGSGYPWGLGSDDLDLPTRILCVADVFEALTSARPYRVALPPAVALGLIKRDAGVSLCPIAVDGLMSFAESLPHVMVS